MRLSPLLNPSRSGNLGIIELNNPGALNALTLDMIECMQDVLADWHMDDSLKAILITAANSDKRPAFCVGGDVKSVYQDAVSGGKEGLSSKFFREEYTVNYAIASWEKPQIAIWDGVVMGGGAGISVHGKYRISTENSLFAMPETAIGFFPDVRFCRERCLIYESQVGMSILLFVYITHRLVACGGCLVYSCPECLVIWL